MIATTTSYLSKLEVVRLVGYDTPHVDGYELIILVQELDDPPDGLENEAALL